VIAHLMENPELAANPAGAWNLISARWVLRPSRGDERGDANDGIGRRTWQLS